MNSTLKKQSSFNFIDEKQNFLLGTKLEECVVCLTISSQNQIILNCLHKVCVDCYNQIISDKKLLQKCPICRRDIFENLDHILYESMDNVVNIPDATNAGNAGDATNVMNATNAVNSESFYDLEGYGNIENNCLCTWYNFFITFKNILLFVFILGVLILLIVLLGLIEKALYK